MELENRHATCRAPRDCSALAVLPRNKSLKRRKKQRSQHKDRERRVPGFCDERQRGRAGQGDDSCQNRAVLDPEEQRAQRQGGEIAPHTAV